MIALQKALKTTRGRALASADVGAKQATGPPLRLAPDPALLLGVRAPDPTLRSHLNTSIGERLGFSLHEGPGPSAVAKGERTHCCFSQAKVKSRSRPRVAPLATREKRACGESAGTVCESDAAVVGRPLG